MTADKKWPLRVLFYADMEALVEHCVAAAEILRNELNADIVMTVLDRNTCVNPAFRNYHVYDHSDVLRGSSRLRLFQRWWSFRRAVIDVDKRETAIRFGGDLDVGRKQPLAAQERSPKPNPEQLFSELQAEMPSVILGCEKQIVSRYEFFGLRKRISKIRTLKSIVYNVRRLPYWYLYCIQRTPGLSQAVRAFGVIRKSYRIKRFLNLIQPDLIIVAEDNIERLSTAIVNDGSRCGIPSIVIPFTIPNPAEPAKAYFNRKANQIRGPISWLIGAMLPKWKYRFQGKSLLRLPVSYLLILEALGHSSPAPWILNRGNASRICLDSEALRDLYRKLGFPEKQLRVVGDVNGQRLYEAQSNKSQIMRDLEAEHEFVPGRPLILCGFPPDQYGGGANDFEFERYDALLEAWISTLDAISKKANVLVRPHPRVPLNRFERLKSLNVRFTMRPTADLIPICDLYVASISATIRWAIACGIPVINYDTYRYRYGDYDEADGVIYTDTLDGFRTNLFRFVSDSHFAANLAERQRKVMHRWGIIDDQLPKRFSDLALELTNPGRR